MNNENTSLSIRNVSLERVARQIMFAEKLLIQSNDYTITRFLLNHIELFISVLSKYYPLNRDLINKYGQFLKWDYWGISHNENIEWTLDLIKSFSDKLVWSELRDNVSIVWSLELINMFPGEFRKLGSEKHIPWSKELITDCKEFISWGNLCENETVPWTDELLEQFKDNINWHQISLNQTILWTEELLEKYKNQLDWIGISKNENIKWTEELLEKYKSQLDWAGISMNEKINWTEEIIERYKNKLNWDYDWRSDSQYGDSMLISSGLNTNKKLPWSIDFIKKYKNKFKWEPAMFPNGMLTYSKNIADNPGIPWSDELIDEFNSSLDFRVLSVNEHIPWSTKLIEKFQNRWDWTELSSNRSLCWSFDLINKFSDLWDWTELSSNPSLPWNLSLIERYKDKWKWGKYGMSSNEGLPLSIELIERYKSKWDWDALSYNQSSEWNLELIIKYKDFWNWGLTADQEDTTVGLSENEKLPWGEPLIDTFRDYWNWDSLSKNKGICWNCEMLIKYKDKLKDKGRWIINKYIPESYEFIEKYQDDFNFEPETAWQKGLKQKLNEKIIIDVFTSLQSIEYAIEMINLYIKSEKWNDLKVISGIAKFYFPELGDAFFAGGLSNYMFGEKRRMNHYYMTSIEDFNQSLGLNFRIKQSYYYLALNNIRLKKYSEAINLLNKASEAGTDCNIFFYKAYAFNGLKNSQEALNNYSKCIEYNLHSPIECERYTLFKAFNNRALVKIRLDDYLGALSDFNSAIDLFNNSIICYKNRAKLYEEMGNLTLAIEDYNNIIKLIPHKDGHHYGAKGTERHFGYYYFKRGDLKMDTGDIIGAQNDWEIALTLGYDLHHIIERLGYTTVNKIWMRIHDSSYPLPISQ